MWLLSTEIERDRDRDYLLGFWIVDLVMGRVGGVED